MIAEIAQGTDYSTAWGRTTRVPASARAPFGRRELAVSLGLLWIVDAALQLQPSQFTTAFPIGLEANAMAQPAALAHLDLFVGRLVAPHLAIWNVAFVLVQFTLGVLILRRQSRRLGLLGLHPMGGGSLGGRGGMWIDRDGFRHVADRSARRSSFVCTARSGAAFPHRPRTTTVGCGEFSNKVG